MPLKQTWSGVSWIFCPFYARGLKKSKFSAFSEIFWCKKDNSTWTNVVKSGKITWNFKNLGNKLSNNVKNFKHLEFLLENPWKDQNFRAAPNVTRVR